MGWIRSGDQRSLGREVACKALLPARRSAGAVAGLLHEAKVTGRLDHPNVVPVHAVGYSRRDGPFIVMKRIIGVSWLTRIQERGPLGDRPPGELREALAPLLEVCQAVEYAHSLGIIHRDIKPSNVMLGDYGEVYLIDWGAAVILDEDPGGFNRQLVGTPAYMAPEVAARTAEPSVRSDIYLLGATLYHVIEGRAPHLGASVVDALVAAAEAGPLVFETAAMAELVAICQRACAPAPEDRYASVADVRGAIEELLGQLIALETLRHAERVHARLALAGAERAGRRREDFAEARFAYEEVRRSWPDNRRARRGLAALTAEQAELELEQGNVAGAASLVEQLEKPPPPLRDRVAEAVRRAGEQKEAPARLAELRAQRKLRAGRWLPAILSIVSGVIALAIGVGVGVFFRGGAELTALTVAGVGVVGGLLTEGALWATRSADLFHSARYRQAVRGFQALLWVNAFGMLVSWPAGLPFEQALVMICLVGMMISTVMTVTIDRSLFPGIVFAAGVTLVVAIWPRYGPDLIGSALMLNGVATAWVVRPQATGE